MTDAPVIVWFRRDLRLSDNPALDAAANTGRPVIPLYVLDETEGLRPPGAAGLWWLDKSLAALAADLVAKGSRLVLRRGEAAAIVRELVKATGASEVVWNRLYDPGLVARDEALGAELPSRSFNAGLLLEPWDVKTKAGGPFKVFTPFWRAARSLVEAQAALPDRKALRAPKRWPRSDDLKAWKLHPARPDWSAGFSAWTPGETGARARLDAFVDERLRDYPRARDRLADHQGTSLLSPHLHFGEIGPRQVWRAVQGAAARGRGLDGAAEKYLAELGWREFNHQLLFHHPDMATAAVRPAYDRMAWRRAPAQLEAWQTGRTGYPIVDAGMRQLWATGFMHNRVRMIAASFLVKDLLIDWREGERWFWDTLVDADFANNAANWQWVAGSGADAQPFFRVFNPTAQGEKFDRGGDYVRRWVPELRNVPDREIHAPGAVDGYPAPIVGHGAARRRALEALRAMRE